MALSAERDNTVLRVRILPGVAAGHPVTAQAGADVLAAGGHAVDAAVAMMLVSCAAETLFTGLGGGGFATVYDAATAAHSAWTSSSPCRAWTAGAPGRGRRSRWASSVRRCRTRSGPQRCGSRDSGRGAPPVAAVGPAGVGRRGGARGGRPVSGHRSRRPTPTCSRGWPRDVVGEGARVFRRPDGALLQAGDRLGHPEHWRAYELLARTRAPSTAVSSRRRWSRPAPTRRAMRTISTGTRCGRAPRGRRARRLTVWPAAPTWTTCWRPWPPRRTVDADPWTTAVVAAWYRAVASNGGARPPTCRGRPVRQRVRDHDQSRAWVRGVGARLRGPPQLDDG